MELPPPLLSLSRKWSQAAGNIEDLDEYTVFSCYMGGETRPPSQVPRRILRPLVDRVVDFSAGVCNAAIDETVKTYHARPAVAHSIAGNVMCADTAKNIV